MIIENIKYKGINGISINKTPGNSIEKDISGWRIAKPVINLDKCIGCKKCFIYCPDVAIIWENDKPVITYSLCKGCGICAQECSVKAIQMVKE